MEKANHSAMRSFFVIMEDMKATNPFKRKPKQELSMEDSLGVVMDEGSAELARRMTDASKKNADLLDFSDSTVRALDEIQDHAPERKKEAAREAIAEWALEHLCETVDAADKWASDPFFEYQDDGSVIFNGEWSIADKGIDTLPPGIQRVEGSLMAAINKFADFTTFPPEINGRLDVRMCQIASWDGFPKQVMEDVRLSSNRLTNFNGAPNKVRGSLDVSENEISSLVGIPLEIGRNLNLQNNPLIFGRDGADQFPTGMTVGGVVLLSQSQMSKDINHFHAFIDAMKKRGLSVGVS